MKAGVKRKSDAQKWTSWANFLGDQTYGFSQISSGLSFKKHQNSWKWSDMFFCLVQVGGKPEHLVIRDLFATRMTHARFYFGCCNSWFVHYFLWVTGITICSRMWGTNPTCAVAVGMIQARRAVVIICMFVGGRISFIPLHCIFIALSQTGSVPCKIIQNPRKDEETSGVFHSHGGTPSHHPCSWDFPVSTHYQPS